MVTALGKRSRHFDSWGYRVGALVRSDEDTMTRAKPLQVASLGLLHVCGLQAWCMHLPPELGERPKGPHLSCLDEVFFHVPFASASMFCAHVLY